MVDRLGAAYRVLRWRSGDEPVTRRDAFDYVAALRVRGRGRGWGGGNCCAGLAWSTAAGLCAEAWCCTRRLPRPGHHPRPPPLLAPGLSLTHSPRARRQVIFGCAHDPREWAAHAPEAMDGQFINEQRWVSMVTDSRLGFGLFEALPTLCKPLA